MSDRTRSLKASLLIIHDTTYGDVVDLPGIYAYAATDNVLQDVEAPTPLSAMDDHSPIALVGELTSDEVPIDFVSWTADGNAPLNLLAAWDDCLVLYARAGRVL